uniref:Uncharacterized protein n=1 Tax=Knoxdaviesia proteae TaxID=1215355 RepID=A0A1J0CYF0_9PEZI|nr:hypothetical protein [Knoxdaviesia proteae]
MFSLEFVKLTCEPPLIERVTIDPGGDNERFSTISLVEKKAVKVHEDYLRSLIVMLWEDYSAGRRVSIAKLGIKRPTVFALDFAEPVIDQDDVDAFHASLNLAVALDRAIKLMHFNLGLTVSGHGRFTINRFLREYYYLYARNVPDAIGPPGPPPAAASATLAHLAASRTRIRLPGQMRLFTGLLYERIHQLERGHVFPVFPGRDDSHPELEAAFHDLAIETTFPFYSPAMRPGVFGAQALMFTAGMYSLGIEGVAAMLIDFAQTRQTEYAVPGLGWDSTFDKMTGPDHRRFLLADVAAYAGQPARLARDNTHALVLYALSKTYARMVRQRVAYGIMTTADCSVYLHVAEDDGAGGSALVLEYLVCDLRNYDKMDTAPVLYPVSLLVAFVMVAQRDFADQVRFPVFGDTSCPSIRKLFEEPQSSEGA